MPKVTVAIPTRNRGAFLERALRSVQAQTYHDAELIVVDNASNDDTADVVSRFGGATTRYVRNDTGLEMLQNWNRCVELAQGSLMVILGDDDVLEPRFLEKSVCRHDETPTLGFSYTHCEKVDREGRHLRRWGYEFAPAGVMSGADYVLWSARYGCCLTNSSTVMMRTDVVREAGGFNAVVAANTFDFNLWLRLAMGHQVCFIDESLVRYTIHDDQISALHWRGEQPTGQIGTDLELLGALAELLVKFPGELDTREVADLLRRANLRLARLLRSTIGGL